MLEIALQPLTPEKENSVHSKSKFHNTEGPWGSEVEFWGEYIFTKYYSSVKINASSAESYIIC